MEKKSELEYVGEILDYKVYRNSDGFLEGFRSKGRLRKDETYSDLDRVVTNQTTEAGFTKFINGRKRSTKVVKAIPPSLFNDGSC